VTSFCNSKRIGDEVTCLYYRAQTGKVRLLSSFTLLHFVCLASLLLLVLSKLQICAAEQSYFEQANRLYEQGKYSEAVSLYESMLKAGRYSVGVLFNLGNSYFKMGDLGRAIYNYRRAATLAPRDPDIQANLRFARDHVSGSASVQPKVWERAVDYFTENELSSGAAIFFWIWLVILCVVRRKPELQPSLRAYSRMSGVLFIATVCLLALGCAEAKEQIVTVIVKQGLVHLGPLQESQAAFNVADGTELRVEARRDEWLQVSDRSNRTGWIDSSQVR
jgi:tetratricopeptide (TPR) repeat protein